MQSTLSIFHRFIVTAPPLLPYGITESMRMALDHFDTSPDATLEEVERVMISFGWSVWPHTQAFKEALQSVRMNMGERFFVPKLSGGLRAKYEECKASGTTWHEVSQGNAAHVFTPEERSELSLIFVDLEQNLRNFTLQHVSGGARQAYIERIGYFKKMLLAIERALNRLRLLADRAQEFPSFSNEIRGQIRSYEHGLCLLGPEPSAHEVEGTVEQYTNRFQRLDVSRAFRRLSFQYS